MKAEYSAEIPTPLPSKRPFLRDFMTAEGDPDDKHQRGLAKKMGFAYRSGIGELIYAMTTCRPDLSYAVVRAAQYSVNPAEIHYHGVRSMLKYLWYTRNDGIYFWRTTPNHSLPKVDLPAIMSRHHEILIEGRPTHDATELHGSMDLEMGGGGLRLAGGTLAYKTSLLKTITQSSTEGEYMEATEMGKMVLFVRSILWDLGIPQCSATVLYEDNDAATAMANAQKPTARARHMDIKYRVLAEWVDRDLVRLERVDTTLNWADHHFTKQLGPLLFRRHVDYILGHVPPQYSHRFREVYWALKKDGQYPRQTRGTPGDSVSPRASGRPIAAEAAKLAAVWDRVTCYYAATL